MIHQYKPVKIKSEKLSSENKIQAKMRMIFEKLINN